MTRMLAVSILALAFTAAGCRSRPESAAMPGMSAAEHAAMSGGAAATDSAAADQPVHLTTAQAQAIGLTYATVTRGPLQRVVRTVGQVVPAEPNLGEITARIDGFVEELFVDATGASVRRGQPLLTIYSPMLVSAEQELLTAARLAATIDTSDMEARRNANELLAAARRRLASWEVSQDQIDHIERTGEVTRMITLRAPFSGTVMEKMVVRGQGVMAGMRLYRLADLSSVWIEGEVFEQDLGLIRVGAPARVEVTAYPGREFQGRVAFVNPVVDEQSRAGRVRVVLENPGGQLRPGMYATLLFEARVDDAALSLPAEAVVMTGQRNLVFILGPDGMLRSREVVVGARAGDRLQVLSGVREGERVVASANFLVDAESRLGTEGGMASMPGMQMDAPATEHKP